MDGAQAGRGCLEAGRGRGGLLERPLEEGSREPKPEQGKGSGPLGPPHSGHRRAQLKRTLAGSEGAGGNLVPQPPPCLCLMTHLPATESSAPLP